MKRNNVYLTIALAMVLSQVGFGLTRSWTSTTVTNSNWFDPTNWSTGVVPTAATSDRADIQTTAAFWPIINADTAVGDIIIGNAGATIPGTANVTINGGVVTIGTSTNANGVKLNPTSGRYAGFYMNGGTLNVTKGNLQVGASTGTAEFFMNGGIVNVTNNLTLPSGSTTGPSRVFLWGGNMRIEGIFNMNPSQAPANVGRFDIRKPGVLTIEGDVRSSYILKNITPGYLSASSATGRAYLVMDYDVTEAGKTTVKADSLTNAQAHNPSPACGLVLDPQGLVLKWSAGDGSPTHRLYFSKNLADVSVPVNTGTYINNATSPYTPTGLELETTYYWRVDEVIGGVTTQGAVWNFTTAVYATIEDFESYAADADLKTAWGTNATLFLKSTTIRPTTENGEKALSFTMPNAVSRTYTTALDWSGFEALGILLHGSPENDVTNPAVSLYIKLTDSASASQTRQYISSTFPVYTASNLVQELPHPWKQWNIDLADFTGINLAAVKTIEIGTVNAAGTLYLDAITGYAARFITWDGDGDLNNDERVNLRDIEWFAKDWLMTSGSVTPVAPAIAPIVTYDFNTDPLETNAKFYAVEYPDNAFYALTPHDTTAGWSFDGGRDGSGCLRADSTNHADMDNVATVFAGISTAASVSVWAKGDEAVLPKIDGQGHSLFGGFPAANENMFTAYVPGFSGTVSFLTGPNSDREDLTWVDAPASATEGSWHHWVFVKDSVSGEHRIYLDGQVVVRKTDVSVDVSPADNPITRFTIGSGPSNAAWYSGLIDDFKLYNYALNDAEVLYLAGKTGPTAITLVSRADLNNSGNVSISDLVILVNDWLSDPLLWPK